MTASHLTTTADPAGAGPAQAGEPAQLPLFDPAEIVACLPPGVGAHRVLGAPGTGKTTLLVELAARRVAAGLDPDELLVLAASRRRADDLRERLSRRLRRTMREPAARTMHSLAFGLLRRHAVLTGAPAPRLVSAPEQDRMLRELLEGHRAGEGGPVAWPAECADALPTRSFRTQLRDLFARATERGLEPEDLRELGRRHDEPAWAAAGVLWREYLDVLELRDAGARDPAGLIAAAVAVLDAGEVTVPWRLVLVDDYHEADPDQERLLRLLARQADVVVAGDPDVTVQTFRGADVQRLAEFPEVFHKPGGRPAETTVLSTSWRRSGPLVATAERVARLLPGAGMHRRELVAATADTAGQAEVHVLASSAREATFLATRLRQEHLHRGTPWSRMAVLTRTRGQAEELRRLLASAGVPVRGTAGDLPLAQERVVAALVTAMQVCLRPDVLDAAALAALLAGPLVGVDPVHLRRLLPRLPAADDPSWWSGADDRRDRTPVARLRRILAAGRAAARAPEVTAETLLWAVWDTAAVAKRWQERALRGGVEGARADRDLDAVMALFALAARAPEGMAGITELLETVSSAQVRADTLRATGVAAEQVDVVTVHEAAGREWDLVALAGMQEGVWPDLRVRGTLLGADRLVDVLAGRPPLAPRDAVAALRREELRLLYLAVTRARRAVLVTAVADDDHEPSAFLDLLDPLDGQDPIDERRCTVVPRQLTLPAVVAELRQTVLAGPDDAAEEAVAELARLAAAGVRGADPSSWHGLLPLTSAEPLRPPGEEVRVSPSRVEAFLTCPLRWHLETSGGRPADSTSQTLGTLVHAIAAELPQGGDLPAMLARLDERWHELDLPTNWRSRLVRQQAEEMLAKLADYQRGTPRALVGVEVDVDVVIPTETHAVHVVGRADRLERDAEGRIVVVDLKTGKHKPRGEEMPRHPQLGVYQLAVEHGGVAGHDAGAGGGVLVHLGANKSLDEQHQQPLRDSDDASWAEAMLTSAAQGMAGAEFEAAKGTHCRTCPVRRSCPLEGQRG